MITYPYNLSDVGFLVVNPEGVRQHIGFAVIDTDEPEYICTEGDIRDVVDDFNAAVAAVLRDEPVAILIRDIGDNEMLIAGVLISASREYAVGFAHGSGAALIYDLYAGKGIKV